MFIDSMVGKSNPGKELHTLEMCVFLSCAPVLASVLGGGCHQAICSVNTVSLEEDHYLPGLTFSIY